MVLLKQTNSAMKALEFFISPINCVSPNIWTGAIALEISCWGDIPKGKDQKGLWEGIQGQDYSGIGAQYPYEPCRKPAPSDHSTGDRKRSSAISPEPVRPVSYASTALSVVPKNHKANNRHNKAFRRMDTFFGYVQHLDLQRFSTIDLWVCFRNI